MKVTIIFDNCGPYHLARLRAAAQVSTLTAIEVAAGSAEYAWSGRSEHGKQHERDTDVSELKIITLMEADTSRTVSVGELARRMEQVLDRLRPEVVFIPGWSSKAAFVALQWCVANRVPSVFMSESTAWDVTRKAWKEWIKEQIARLASAALAGGTPHADYLQCLGIPADQIVLGYDAVDNVYFADKAVEARSQQSQIKSELGLPNHYFLASSRFIEKKNLPRLIAAYSHYRQLASQAEDRECKAEIWDLVLIGDGALRRSLESQVSNLGLQHCVWLPGFKQYPSLPHYYANAEVFIHASTSEQWGLVVNEAMASGLPVLVSNRCGCAMDLVRDGVNGFTFNPYDVKQLAQLMLKVSDFRFPISDFRVSSQRIIADWGPERFARGLRAAAAKALDVGSRPASLVQKLILKAMLAK